LWLALLALCELGLAAAFVFRHEMGESWLLLIWLAMMLVTWVLGALVIDQERRFNKELQALRGQNTSLAKERSVLEEVLTNIRSAEDFDDRGINYLLESVGNTAGDILLAARRPDAVRHYLIGDFTGHGLSSAMASPTVADIFYSMTKKGIEPGAILQEMNAKLCTKLPANIFLAAAFLEVDEQRGMLRVWNAGLPDQLVLRQGTPWQRLASDALPLGIVPDWQLDEVAELGIQPGDAIYAFSDGAIEVANADSELFGVDRLELELCRISSEERPLHSILGVLSAFGGKGERSDDISLLEIRVGKGPGLGLGILS
jgi:serine phosphatase RsbU (regulator of sigma subunit)